MIYLRTQQCDGDAMQCLWQRLFEQYDLRDIIVVSNPAGCFIVHMRLPVNNGAVTVSLPCPCLQYGWMEIVN